MHIGINALAAFKKERTGVEEYTYQILKNIMMLPESREHQFFLYTNKKFKAQSLKLKALENFYIKKINFPILWTQIGLSYELFKNPVEALFIPAHILPNVYPENSTVTIHGLEYEKYPKFYPFFFRQYLRYVTKRSAEKAKKIIVPSQSTKNDLINCYRVNPEKIYVIYHGIDDIDVKHSVFNKSVKHRMFNKLYILYLGRIEEKKNLLNAIKVFNLLKEKYKLPHKFILAGPNGYLHEKIFAEAKKSKFADEIIFKGYITKEEKQQLLSNADLFYLVSWYEGFGMPILEAQAAGIPVITSNISSIPEVAGAGQIFVSPDNVEEITEMVYRILSNKNLRDTLIKSGFDNYRKFSWQKAAKKTLEIILK